MDAINILEEEGTISFGMEHRERGDNQPGRHGDKASEAQCGTKWVVVG